DGSYHIQVGVRPVFDGELSSDSDFHVTRNGQQLFAQSLPANTATGYTNSLSLVAGDTIDFSVGRGADGSAEHTALKIQATITSTTGPPPPIGDLVVNGSFELGIDPGPGGIQINAPDSTSITAWTVVSGNIDYVTGWV